MGRREQIKIRAPVSASGERVEGQHMVHLDILEVACDKGHAINFGGGGKQVVQRGWDRPRTCGPISPLRLH